MYDVPLPSERWTRMMSRAGSVTPGFAATSAGSFHFVIFPRKMPAIASGVSFNPLFTPSALYVTTTAPMTVGKCRILPGAACSCSSVIGPSLAPKSTVCSVICLIPPPLPID